MKRSPWRYLWISVDIRRKLLITIAILAIYRFASHVPVPGADPEVIRSILAGGGAAGTLVGLLDLLSGGTVSNFSIMAMGVYPYITAQIILQLLTPIIPALQKKMEEVKQTVDKMVEQMQKNQVLSPETLEKYQELQQLMQEMNSPEFAEAMKKLQQSMQQVNPEALKQAMQQFNFSEENFRKSIERTMNLMKRIQIEQKVDEAVKRAEELRKQQEDLQHRTEKLDPKDRKSADELAKEQKDLQEQMAKMQKQLEELQKKMNAGWFRKYTHIAAQRNGLAVAAVKGGTAKTTTAVSLAHALALAGRRVLLVDCDPKRHAALHFGLPLDGGVAALLRGESALAVEVRAGLQLVDSGGAGLAAIERGLDHELGGAEPLRQVLESAACDVDYVLLDCPPWMGPVHRAALLACDEVLLPVSADYLSLASARPLLQLVQSLPAERRPRLLGLLPTFYVPDAPSAAQVEAVLREAFAGHVLQTRIHLSEALRAAPAQRGTVFDSDPLSRGALDYALLATEIEAHAA